MKKGDTFKISGFTDDHKYQLVCKMIKDEPKTNICTKFIYPRYRTRTYCCNVTSGYDMLQNFNKYAEVIEVIKIG